MYRVQKRAVRPMLAVSQGRLVALSTPFGQRGWFYDEWHGGGPWKRVRITWRDCPRITPEFIAEEARALGPQWVAQEYECSFVSMHGLVYPDFADAVVDIWPNPVGRRVGGIDGVLRCRDRGGAAPRPLAGLPVRAAAEGIRRRAGRGR